MRAAFGCGVSGRAPDFDPRDQATPTGAIKRLEEQDGELFKRSDFIPLPCSHRDCVPGLPQLLGGLWKQWRDKSAVSSENIEWKTV